VESEFLVNLIHFQPAELTGQNMVVFSGGSVAKNQSCAGAPRCKQWGMFTPPLEIPLKETITLNNLV
jgi:hypothetical protein